MRSPNCTLLNIDSVSRGFEPNGGIHNRHCSTQAAPGCARSPIADALPSIPFQAKAIRIGNAAASSAEAELDLSVRHIINSAKRVWSILGDTHGATCICRKLPT
jgi:hypothetical protein